MIAKTYINNNLTQLNYNFINSKSSKMSLYYSKISIIELSGWVEESMDDIILRCCNRTIKEGKNKTVVSQIIKSNYGLTYKSHFRVMLMKVIGLINLEKLEKRVGILNIDQLSNHLSILKDKRNEVAHTHIKGVAATINAPSVTLASFNSIYSVLKSIELELKNIGC